MKNLIRNTPSKTPKVNLCFQYTLPMKANFDIKSVLENLEFKENKEIPYNISLGFFETMKEMFPLLKLVNNYNIEGSSMVVFHNTPQSIWDTKEEIKPLQLKASKFHINCQRLGTGIVLTPDLLRDPYFNLSDYLINYISRIMGKEVEKAIITGNYGGEQGVGLIHSPTNVIKIDEIAKNLAKVVQKNNGEYANLSWLLNSFLVGEIEKIREIYNPETKRLFGYPVHIFDMPDDLFKGIKKLPEPFKGDPKNLLGFFGDFNSYCLLHRSLMELRKNHYNLSPNTEITTFKAFGGHLLDASGINSLILG